jgi:hypothetical protein
MTQDIMALIILVVSLAVGFWFCSVFDSQRK